jgi:hypothetical protein
VEVALPFRGGHGPGQARFAFFSKPGPQWTGLKPMIRTMNSQFARSRVAWIDMGLGQCGYSYFWFFFYFLGPKPGGHILNLFDHICFVGTKTIWFMWRMFLQQFGLLKLNDSTLPILKTFLYKIITAHSLELIAKQNNEHVHKHLKFQQKRTCARRGVVLVQLDLIIGFHIWGQSNGWYAS